MIDLTKYPYFQFKGRRSNEFNMRIKNDMTFELPEIILDFESVDGRSSSVIFDKKRRSDIEKSFTVRIYKKKDSSIPAQLREIANWLYSSQGYENLVFSEYDDYYYKAIAYKSVSARDERREFLDVTFTFKCQPFMFRVDGSNERVVDSGSSITNPEIFESLPLIKFNKNTPSSDSNIYINGQHFRISKDAGVGEITLDCENGIAYKNGGVNVSKFCFINNAGYSPIALKSGKNEISYNNIDNFRIVPNWRSTAI